MGRQKYGKVKDGVKVHLELPRHLHDKLANVSEFQGRSITDLVKQGALYIISIYTDPSINAVYVPDSSIKARHFERPVPSTKIGTGDLFQKNKGTDVVLPESKIQNWADTGIDCYLFKNHNFPIWFAVKEKNFNNSVKGVLFDFTCKSKPNIENEYTFSIDEFNNNFSEESKIPDSIQDYLSDGKTIILDRIVERKNIIKDYLQPKIFKNLKFNIYCFIKEVSNFGVFGAFIDGYSFGFNTGNKEEDESNTNYIINKDWHCLLSEFNKEFKECKVKDIPEAVKKIYEEMFPYAKL